MNILLQKFSEYDERHRKMLNALNEIIEMQEVTDHPGHVFVTELYDSASFDFGYNRCLYDIKMIISKNIRS